MKKIKKAEGNIRDNTEPEVIELERGSSDISDEEAAEVFLRNKKNTGTRSKNDKKCDHCNFVANDANLLKGHMSVHKPGNGNYENGICWKWNSEIGERGNCW